MRHWDNAGEIISTAAMTILLFIFAEVTPKTFAIQQTDRVGLLTAPILVFLTRLVVPFAKGLLRLANVIMPGKGLKQGPYITEQELRASGETARKRDASTSVALTAQEKQVATFIAEGLSNREVAAKLFLSPRTIDFHLRNVFAKTGITSRGELARIPLG